MSSESASRSFRLMVAMLLFILAAALAGCEAPDWSITSPEGAEGKTFVNEDVRIEFRQMDPWLRIRIENLSGLAVSWNWPKYSFTVPGGISYTVAYIDGFTISTGRYEPAPPDGFVPTLKDFIRTGNATKVIPEKRVLYAFVCLTKDPKEYQYFQEHAYEDHETVKKRMNDLQEKFDALRDTYADSLGRESDAYLDLIPRLAGKGAYGEYHWKIKYYVGDKLKNVDMVFTVKKPE